MLKKAVLLIGLSLAHGVSADLASGQVRSAATCPSAPRYELLDSHDLSTNDVFRVRVDVRLPTLVSVEALEAVTCREVTRRQRYRVLHVLEVRAWGAGGDTSSAAQGTSVWAPFGDADLAARYAPGDTSEHLILTSVVGQPTKKSRDLIRRSAAHATRPTPVKSATPIATPTPYRAPSPTVERSPTPQPAPASAASTTLSNAEQVQVLEVVELWRAAWQALDIERYMKFYTPDFESDGKSSLDWRNHKARTFAATKRARIVLSDYQVTALNGRAIVEFTQVYESDRLSDVGKKRLELEHRLGRYQIVGESWRPLSD